jgi:hypothetical protein
VSLIQLICTHPHALLPAMSVGATITFIPRQGGYDLQAPGTPNFLSRIAQAFRDGALELTDGSDPALAELEAQIMADRDRLLAEADALLQEIRARQAARVG